MTDQSEKIKEEFKRNAKREGLCESQHLFALGSHGTVYVSCGLPDEHDVDQWEDDSGLYSPVHITTHRQDDGSSVTFRWTGE